MGLPSKNPDTVSAMLLKDVAGDLRERRHIGRGIRSKNSETVMARSPWWQSGSRKDVTASAWGTYSFRFHSTHAQNTARHGSNSPFRLISVTINVSLKQLYFTKWKNVSQSDVPLKQVLKYYIRYVHLINSRQQMGKHVNAPHFLS